MAKQKAEIHPVYFLYGPEDYLINEEIQRLLDRCLPPRERELNLHLFSGEEHSGLEIVQTAQTLPMFARYRFVLVREADQIDKKKIETLLKYIGSPSPTTCLVLHGQTSGLWKGYLTAIEQVGKVKEYPRLKIIGIIPWMKNRMLEKGKTLTEDAAEYLGEIVGDHLQDVENTLEKVFLSVGEKERIELSDVDGVASEFRISTVFDLTDAIGHQNLEKALGILEKTMETRSISFKKDEEISKKMDDPVPLLLSMMAKQYWNILGVKKMTSSNLNVSDVAKALRISSWHVRKILQQAKNFSESSLSDGITKCHQTDLSIKRGQGPKDLLMEKLVIDLCCPNTSQNDPFTF
jgi:DNA polymerase-3 subunit delta